MQLTGIFSGNKGDESCLSLEASGFSDPEAIEQGARQAWIGTLDAMASSSIPEL